MLFNLKFKQMILSKIALKKTHFTKLLALALLVSFSFSCSKADVKDGAPGADGNANVFVSEWLQIKFDTKNDGDDSGIMIIPIENIADLVNNGTVFLMYFKTAVDDQFIVYPLPYDNNTFLFAIVNSEIIGEGLAFVANTSNVSELENKPEYTVQYVVIPKSNAISSIDYTKMSYEEVVESLNLE